MRFFSKIFGISRQKQSLQKGSFLGKKIADVTPSDVFKTIIEFDVEKEAGKSFSSETDRLISELVDIGRTDGFLSMKPGDKFNENHRNIRAREIGESLNKMGGKELMLSGHCKVRDTVGRTPARELEAVWSGIGDWLG